MDQNEKFNIALALRDFLEDPPPVALSEIVEWEKALQRDHRDATVREVYADWLQERGCFQRECRAREEAERIRNHPHTIEGELDAATATIPVNGTYAIPVVKVMAECGHYFGIGSGVNPRESESCWEITDEDAKHRLFIFTRTR